MISRQTIANILETARIEEVIGEFVKLKKSGQNYKGLSPFTDEKTPSFVVSPAKSIFKCFSSGKGGNVVNFLMEHEHLNYPEALKWLAKKYNILIEEDQASPEDTQAQSERESLFQVSAFAQKYFSEQLFETEKGKAIGLQYFKGRDMSMETIKKFQLGYSPDEWDAFTKYALDQGYNKDYLEKTGLSIVKESRAYDRFRGRVIFPIHNISGRVLGFGGRTLLSDANIPKYVNSPESEIYNKSQILYGLYFAKNAIIRLDSCLLVEGYTDVISLQQAGIENVVASSGTSLTTEQIKLIRRYTNNITILYDGDPAGIKASFRGIDMVLEEGMNVRIVLLPDNEDPDSFARKHRRTEVEEFISREARDFIRFKTSLLLDEASDDPIKRAGLIKEIVGSIALIPDGIYRSVYIRECSALMDMAEQTLINELNKVLRQKSRKKSDPVQSMPEQDLTESTAPEQTVTDVANIDYQEKALIRIMMMYANNDLVFIVKPEEGPAEEHRISVAAYLLEEIRNDGITFRNPVYQKIFDEFAVILDKGESPDEHFFVRHQDDEVVKAAMDLLLSRYELSENWLKNKIPVTTEVDILQQTVEHTLLAFKARTIDRMILELQKELKVSQSDEDMMISLSRMKELKEISKKINAELGRVIIR